MNRIVIVDDEIKEKELNKDIVISLDKNIADINQININILSNTDLIIDYTSTDKTKLDICTHIAKDVTCNIYESKQEGQYKIQYKYYLLENSKLNIYKINDVLDTNELLIFNLDGQKANVNYILKTISTNEEKYDFMVYHNKPNTTSNIITNGVSIKDSKLQFNVSSFVSSGITECTLNQNNRIINLNNNKCMIRPNLFIDENNVVANHSAHIGKCNEDELFYLMSRGINKKDAENLIIKGFLLKGLTNNQDIMENIINKYWR